MKKYFFLFILIFLSALLVADEDLPEIIIPEIDIKIEDIKKIDLPVTPEKEKNEINIQLPLPEIDDKINIDLEKILPSIEKEIKIKALDVSLLLGYGLNHHFYADFSLFIKNIMPKVSLHYLRESKENIWFDELKKNPISKDDLNAQIAYNYKNFFLSTTGSFYSYSYKPGDNTIYDLNIKRFFYIDINPSVKFKYNNDLSLNIFNSFIFNEAQGKYEDKNVNHNNFSYFLNTQLIYNQIFLNIHSFSFKLGYNFNYLYDFLKSRNDKLLDDYSHFFFNSFNAGIDYSTVLKESFQIKGAFTFSGLFKDKEFYWYILPLGNFGYFLKEFFYAYIEGGGKLEEKPSTTWFKKYNYTFMPISLIYGNNWYAKTGVAATLPGWIRGNIDFEFAYKHITFNWKKINKVEDFYILENSRLIELNLYTGVIFNYREYINITINWIHKFYQRMFFIPQDELIILVKSIISETGLAFYLEFSANFVRFNTEYQIINNLYVLNSGLEWNYKEKIGVGIKGNNLLFFNENNFFPEYEDRALEILGYLKIAF